MDGECDGGKPNCRWAQGKGEIATPPISLHRGCGELDTGWGGEPGQAAFAWRSYPLVKAAADVSWIVFLEEKLCEGKGNLLLTKSSLKRWKMQQRGLQCRKSWGVGRGGGLIHSQTCQIQKQGADVGAWILEKNNLGPSILAGRLGETGV